MYLVYDLHINNNNNNNNNSCDGMQICRFVLATGQRGECHVLLCVNTLHLCDHRIAAAAARCRST